MKKTIFALVFAALLFTGCSKGFQSNQGTAGVTSTGSGSGSGSSGSGTGSTPATWDKVDVNGFASGGANAGQLVVYIDQQKQSLLLVLPIPVIIPIFNQVDIPDAPGAYLTSYTDSQGNTSMAINVPLQYIVRDSHFTGGQRLPSGDPLPFVPAGELPGFGVQFPQMPNYRVYLYIGVNVAAAFVELPDFGLPIGGIFPVKNKTKTKVVGAIGYVTPKMNHAGGMYLATQIPDEMARMIDELIRW
jgi:hypothetical protein